ncbi:MAG: hypothetical protein WBW74_09850 [Xanthobacteraceae bacterium]
MGMKPACASSEPVAGVMENGRPSSFIARESAALLGSLPRKKTWVSVDMAQKSHTAEPHRLQFADLYDGSSVKNK